MNNKLYLQRRIITLEERVAMLETKQELLLEALGNFARSVRKDEKERGEE